MDYQFAQKTLPGIDQEKRKEFGFKRSKDVLVKDNNEDYHIAYYDHEQVHDGWSSTKWRKAHTQDPLHNVVTWSDFKKHL